MSYLYHSQKVEFYWSMLSFDLGSWNNIILPPFCHFLSVWGHAVIACHLFTIFNQITQVLFFLHMVTWIVHTRALTIWARFNFISEFHRWKEKFSENLLFSSRTPLTTLVYFSQAAKYLFLVDWQLYQCTDIPTNFETRMKWNPRQIHDQLLSITSNHRLVWLVGWWLTLDSLVTVELWRYRR